MPKVKIEVSGFECIRCGYRWVPRLAAGKKPKACAHCMSVLWDKPRVGRWPKKV